MKATVNENLERERKSASFNINELTDLLYYGKKNNNRRKEIGMLNFNEVCHVTCICSKSTYTVGRGQKYRDCL